MNANRLPGAIGVQSSLSVSGVVALTATRSLGDVTRLKSSSTSSSARWATANGAWRMMYDRRDEQCANSQSPSESRKLNSPRLPISVASRRSVAWS